MIFSRFKWNSGSILELTRPLKAYIYYRYHRLNLLTGFPESYPIGKFQNDLNNLNFQDKVKHPVVYHFYYEYSFLEAGLSHLVGDDNPLAIEIEYQKSTKTNPRIPRISTLPLKTLERPTWSEYKVAFQKVQEDLLNGNCYQVNLTFPYDFYTDEVLDPRDIADYFFAQKNLGAYAHATYFGEEMILSNSPECLFQYKGEEVFTMPIKGTMKRKKGEFKETWEKMLNDQKEKGELLMITDLLKNDLNRLDQARARVIKLRAPLLVPNLLHQYSLIAVKLKKNVSLAKSMDALFPGGSITGAPKKRVMTIISEIERFRRGIYCGSTLLCYKDRKVANINIRTASINVEEKVWRYGAGGGVTLLSKVLEEYQEMESKVSSFLTLLKLRGY